MKLSPQSRATRTLASTSSSVTLRNSAPSEEAPKLRMGSSRPVRPKVRVGSFAFIGGGKIGAASGDKKRPQMALVEVLRHIAANHLFIGFQEIQVTAAFLGGELE